MFLSFRIFLFVFQLESHICICCFVNLIIFFNICDSLCSIKWHLLPTHYNPAPDPSSFITIDIHIFFSTWVYNYCVVICLPVGVCMCFEFLSSNDFMKLWCLMKETKNKMQNSTWYILRLWHLFNSFFLLQIFIVFFLNFTN